MPPAGDAESSSGRWNASPYVSSRAYPVGSSGQDTCGTWSWRLRICSVPAWQLSTQAALCIPHTARDNRGSSDTTAQSYAWPYSFPDLCVPCPELSHDFTFVHNCSCYRDKYTKLSKLICNIHKIIAKYIGITGITFAQMIIPKSLKMLSYLSSHSFEKCTFHLFQESKFGWHL